MEALERHAEEFAHSINRLKEAQFNKLSEQLTEISESNRAAHLSRPAADVELGAPEAVRGGRRRSPRNSDPAECRLAQGRRTDQERPGMVGCRRGHPKRSGIERPQDRQGSRPLVRQEVPALGGREDRRQDR